LCRRLSTSDARRLASALKLDQGIIDRVMLASAQQRHDSARAKVLAEEESYGKAFRPHLQVQTERRVPSPIFVAAIMGVHRLRIVALPDEALSASPEARDQIVKRVIIDHYRSSSGHIPAFGAITGYVLVLSPGYDRTDFGIHHNEKGRRTGPMRSVPRLSSVTLELKQGDNQQTAILSPARRALAASLKVDSSWTPGAQ
jgi:hypothetical protein